MKDYLVVYNVFILNVLYYIKFWLTVQEQSYNT